MRTRYLVPGLTFALAFLFSGCGNAPPPPPPGATVEQLRAVADAADAVRKDMAKLDSRVGKVDEKLEDLQEAVQDARTRNEALSKQRQDSNQALLDRLDRLEMELTKRTEKPAERAPAVPAKSPLPIKGQILAADSAMDIYLVSVGSKDGLKIADELTVFRGSSFVAVVIVDQVFHDKASVVVKKIDGNPVSKSPIKTGDRVSGGMAEPPPPGDLPTPIKGHVLAVDPEKDIYLVSVGKKDGVKIADELTVFRGDSFVAVVVVDTVLEDKSSVVVKKLNGKPMLKSEIKVGDKVATAL